MSKTGKKILVGVGGLFILGALGTTAAYFASDNVHSRLNSFISELKEKNTDEVQNEIDDNVLETYKFDFGAVADYLEVNGVTDNDIVTVEGSGSDWFLDFHCEDDSIQMQFGDYLGFNINFDGFVVSSPSENYVPLVENDISVLQYLRNLGVVDLSIPKILGSFANSEWNVTLARYDNPDPIFESSLDNLSQFIK